MPGKVLWCSLLPRLLIHLEVCGSAFNAALHRLHTHTEKKTCCPIPLPVTLIACIAICLHGLLQPAVRGLSFMTPFPTTCCPKISLAQHPLATVKGKICCPTVGHRTGVTVESACKSHLLVGFPPVVCGGAVLWVGGQRLGILHHRRDGWEHKH